MPDPDIGNILGQMWGEGDDLPTHELPRTGSIESRDISPTSHPNEWLRNTLGDRVGATLAMPYETGSDLGAAAKFGDEERLRRGLATAAQLSLLAGMGAASGIKGGAATRRVPMPRVTAPGYAEDVILPETVEPGPLERDPNWYLDRDEREADKFWNDFDQKWENRDKKDPYAHLDREGREREHAASARIRAQDAAAGYPWTTKDTWRDAPDPWSARQELIRNMETSQERERFDPNYWYTREDRAEMRGHDPALADMSRAERDRFYDELDAIDRNFQGDLPFNQRSDYDPVTAASRATTVGARHERYDVGDRIVDERSNLHPLERPIPDLVIHPEPVDVYHGTRKPEDFQEFRLPTGASFGVHAGTKPQADIFANDYMTSYQQKSPYKPRVYPLRIGPPDRPFTSLKVSDLGAWYPPDLVEELQRRGLRFSPEEMKAINEAYLKGRNFTPTTNPVGDRDYSEAYKAIGDVLNRHGIDVMHYKNTLEVPGDTSWLTWNPNTLYSKLTGKKLFNLAPIAAGATMAPPIAARLLDNEYGSDPQRYP